MTLLERKAKFIQAILNNEDEAVFSEIEQLFYSKRPLPCQYTLDEVKAGIRKSIEDAEGGNIISHDEEKRCFFV